VRSRDLVGASRDLFVRFRDSFKNHMDLLVILDPTNGININCHSSSRALALGGGDFWPFIYSCSFLLYHSKVFKLILNSFSLNPFGLARPKPTCW
jgi:hypothetical protein